MKIQKVVYGGIFSTVVLISQLTTLPHVQTDEKKKYSNIYRTKQRRITVTPH
ncbi:hypothetical protein BN2127_JRS10_01719 [Bacillus subtilis]|nr:hypothetical protein BN2127_JRS10_01719 [Bacillus subtilis]